MKIKDGRGMSAEIKLETSTVATAAIGSAGDGGNGDDGFSS